MSAAAKTYYSLTFQNLQDEATHAIGGTADSRAPITRIVNAALEYLWNAHPWSWREAITTLDFSAGVGQIPLPTDFGEMIDLVGFQARYTAVKAADWRDIARVRVYGLPDQHVMLYHVGGAGQYSVPNPVNQLTAVEQVGSGTLLTGGYYIRYSIIDTVGAETMASPEQLVTLDGTGGPNNQIQLTFPALPAQGASYNLYVGTATLQEQLVATGIAPGNFVLGTLPATTQPFWPQSNSTYDPTSVITKVLEVAPVPATTLVQALYLTYRRAAPQLVNATDVPQVPYMFFDLLRTICRAMAVSSTTQQAGHDWQLFNDQLGKYKAADTQSMGLPDHMIDCLDIDDGLYALRPWMAIKTPYDP